jgi:hypothetical protein
VRRLLLSAVLFAGCQFTVSGLAIDSPGGGGDMAQPVTGDLSGADLLDLSIPDAPPVYDLVPPADLAPPFTPSHISPVDLTIGTGDVSPTSTINTDGTVLQIDGAGPPPGTTFFLEAGKYAVLAVRNFTVASGKTVRVTGAYPLIVVASGSITIDGTLDAGGKTNAPGPGGSTPGMGSGAGTTGAHSVNADSGGSGAGYAVKGGDSGDDTGCPMNKNALGVTGGAANGDPKLMMLLGGSGGGKGGQGGCNANETAVGGAGGGALQLTAVTAVTIIGTINVGGGGGGGGCKNPMQVDSGSGAGGGSGGSLLLESPTVTVSGTLGANGGGGGGGAYLTPGGIGGDGTSTPGTGGSGGNNMAIGGTEVTNDRGGPGSMPSGNDPACGNTGGGGGAVGRIYLHASSTPNTSGSTISPQATIDNNL